MKQYIKMFKNDNKQENDSKPVYQNSNFKFKVPSSFFQIAAE